MTTSSRYGYSIGKALQYRESFKCDLTNFKLLKFNSSDQTFRSVTYGYRIILIFSFFQNPLW